MNLPQAHPDAQPLSTPFMMALAEAVHCAVEKFTATERILKAVQIVLADKVTILDTHIAEVASQFGTTTYTVNGACPCPDYPKAKGLEGYCKHMMAVWLVRKAQRILEAAQAQNIEDGSTCPQCGHQCVVCEGSRQYGVWLICRYALTIGTDVWACNWKEVVR